MSSIRNGRKLRMETGKAVARKHGLLRQIKAGAHIRVYEKYGSGSGMLALPPTKQSMRSGVPGHLVSRPANADQLAADFIGICGTKGH